MSNLDKSQGSEWDFVIFYIPEFNTGSFLNKNRVYTAITRTKRCCWCVVTDIDAFNAASVKPLGYRCENLARKLKSELPNMPAFRIPPLNQNLTMTDDLPVEVIPDYADNGVDSDDF